MRLLLAVLIALCFLTLIICKNIDYPICFVTRSGRVLFSNKSFHIHFYKPKFGQNIFATFKQDASGYVEMASGKSGFITMGNLIIMRIIVITPSSPLPYITIDRSGLIIKSRWPFISEGDNFFAHVKIAPEQLLKCHNIIVTELDGVRVVLALCCCPEYITITELSSVIRPETIKMATLGKETLKITHDLNNSLTGILGFCELLSAKAHNTNEVNGIRSNAEHAVELMRQLLSWAKPKREKLCHISPYKTLMQMKLFLKCIAGSRSKIHICGSIKSSTAISPSAFEQIVTNLVTNARDANASAIAINITEECLEETEWTRGIVSAGRYILLTVSDSGSGIELENHQKLFAVEYSTKENGTGQGLSIIADLLQEVGGFVSYIPANCRTTFKIGFPVVTPPKCNDQSVEVAVARVVKISKILVVEDNASIRTLMQRVLKEQGHIITVAGTLKDAKAQIMNNDFDIVLTDSDLPDGDGVELVSMAKCRVIVSSGYSKDSLAIKKDFEFLPKPFTIRELSDIVQSVNA